MRPLCLLVISVACGCGGGGVPPSEAPGSTGDPEGGAFVTTASSFTAEGPRSEAIVEAVYTNDGPDPVTLETCGRDPLVRVQKQTGSGWTDVFPVPCQGPEVEILVGPGQSKRVERRMAMAANEEVVPQPLTGEIEGTYRLGILSVEGVTWSNAFAVEAPR